MILDIERKRAKKSGTTPRPKKEEPKKYQAIYSQPAGMEIECAVCLVRDAFNLTARKAHRHVLAAEKTGKALILASTKEVVAEKIRTANKVLAEGRFCSFTGHGFVRFTSERAP